MLPAKRGMIFLPGGHGKAAPVPLVHGVCHASRCCSSPAHAVQCQQGVQVPKEAPSCWQELNQLTGWWLSASCSGFACTLGS